MKLPRLLQLSVVALTLMGSILPEPVQAATIVVGITDSGPSSTWGYTVDPVVAAPGDTVTWVNQGTTLHTVTADGGWFDSGLLRSGQSFSVVADVPGPYTYHCTFHPFILGTIIVGGADPGAAPVVPTGPAPIVPPPDHMPGHGSAPVPAGFEPSPPSAFAAIRRPWEGKANGVVREFRLDVQRVQWDYGSGVGVPAYSFNGQVPGPEIRVTEGDTVKVTVRNALDEETTIHWHGVELPTNMDGVPGLSQQPIPAGGSFIYEFVATPAGTRWYHSHANEQVQVGGGLFGALIIEPRTPEGAAPDREYVLTTGESKAKVALGQGAFSINGKSYPYAVPLSVRQGELVRLRLINAGAAETQVFALAGHALRVTHLDGNRLAQPVPVDSVMLGPSERADVEFVANNAGRWQLRGMMPGQADSGLAVDLVYEGYEGAAVQIPATIGSAWNYQAFAGPQRSGDPYRTFAMILGSRANSDMPWLINSKAYPETEQLVVRPGERILVSFTNLTTVDHAMHLHGHSFQLVGIGGRPMNGPVKDTVTVGPQEQYDIEFTAANPGDWLFHCHNLDHMMGGMMTELHYR